MLLVGFFLYSITFGKIINFDISSDEILWENNLKEIIIDFIQYSNALILLTENNFTVKFEENISVKIMSIKNIMKTY